MSTHPVVHRASPTCLLTTLSARYRCDFTVFTFIRMASAISGNSSSSTKRSRKMLRCRSLNVSTARHTVATRSCAISRCSVELCRVRQPVAHLGRIQHRRPLPEAQLHAALVVAHQVHGDAHQPGAHRALAAKAGPAPCAPAKSNPGSATQPRPRRAWQTGCSGRRGRGRAASTPRRRRRRSQRAPGAHRLPWHSRSHVPCTHIDDPRPRTRGYNRYPFYF